MQGVTSIAAIKEERRATAGHFGKASKQSRKGVKSVKHRDENPRLRLRRRTEISRHVGSPYERDVARLKKK